LSVILYGNKHDKNFALGAAVLAEIFDVAIDDLESNLNILAAVKIFLQYKMFGQDYQSEIGNGNTCLHDAIGLDDFSDDLIKLLIESGADPEKVNDDQHTPLALVIQDFHGYNSKVISALCDYDKPSHERIIFALSSIIRDLDEQPIPVLEAAEKLQFFEKHPDILNFNCRNSSRSNLLLHTAAETCSRCGFLFVIQWCQSGFVKRL
jgi:ankyrin repeat protein